jgi:hypothetical protein
MAGFRSRRITYARANGIVDARDAVDHLIAHAR